MRRKEDLRSLTIVVCTWIFQLAVIASSASLEIFELSILFVINIIAVFLVSLVNHNHRHCLIFENEVSNKLTNALISFAMLAPSTRLHAVHLLNHHTHYESDKDWASYLWAKKFDKGILRACEYLFVACKNMFTLRSSLSLTKDMATNLKIEKTLVVIYSITLLLIAPKIFIFWLLPSCSLGLLLLLLGNLINHDHCELTSEFDHSRNFTSKIENYFLTNNGYHTAHHLRPGMHWADYPDFHKEKLVRLIKPENEQKSFIVYLLKNYL